MSVEKILSRLKKVKLTGRGAYVACCPAHNDETPSLTITAKDDGRILIHCFAGCETGSVLDAIGIEMGELFPERLGEFKPEKHPFTANQLFELIAKELITIALCASKLAEQPISDTDRDQLFTSIARIMGVLHAGGYR